jgi:hypothetical protein
MSHAVLGLMLLFSFGAATLMLLRFVKVGRTN